MRQLVRHEPVAREVEMRFRVVQRRIGLRGGGGVLHPAENEVRHGYLRVLDIRIREPQFLAEEPHHFRRLPERTLALGLAARVNVIGHRDAAYRRRLADEPASYARYDLS